MTKKHKLLLLTLTLIGTTPLFASGPSFQPDTTIDGIEPEGLAHRWTSRLAHRQGRNSWNAQGRSWWLAGTRPFLPGQRAVR